MKIFEKKHEGNKIKIYFCNKKIFSVKTKNYSKFKKIYSKRFKGLTENEARYILEYQFNNMAGYKLNLDNPQTFNEKIQWLKLYYRNPLMTKCADKVGVRDFIKEKLGEEYLVPIIGVYNSVDEIDFSLLPNKFVMKVNWGSGQNIIVTDKSKLDVEDAVKKLKNWLKPENNHYYNFLEWAYKDIKPKIIIEEFIDNLDDVRDFKFFCFNGKAKYMLVCGERRTNLYEDCYDMDLKFLPFTNGARNSLKALEKPKSYKKMVEFSELLSKNFPHVRVDFYEDCLGRPKFGEMTFYSGNGTDIFDPIEYDYMFGKDLVLPNLKGDN